MLKSLPLILTALALTALPTFAANRESAQARQQAKEQAREARVVTAAERFAAAKANHEIGGKLAYPLAQTITKANSPQDKLLVEISYAVPQANGYVAELKIVWGDLDNLIKKCGKQYYSNWDGSVDITSGTGLVIHKIQFDDQSNHKLTPPGKTPAGPGPGSGRDQLLTSEGTKIEWKAGVVGALDGLAIRITNASSLMTGTIKAGNFTIPFTIGPAPAGTATPAITPTPKR